VTPRRILLVRNAKAAPRAAWDGPDLLRPLSSLGLRQAEQLAADLRKEGTCVLLSSPALRCRQTLEPFSRSMKIPIANDAALGPGAPPDKALRHVLDAGATTLVVCTHGELAGELAALLEEQGDVDLRRLGRSDVSVDEESRRLAVLDLGSTSFHLLVADANAAGHLQPIDREREQLRLGALTAVHDEIPAEVVERAVATARALRDTAFSLGAEDILPVGTSALREARNGPALRGALEEAIGRPVRMLSGEEEARLVFGAMKRRVLVPEAPVLATDLGGGSLEIVVAERGQIRFEHTFRLGAASLHGELVASDPMRGREVRAVCERVAGSLAPELEGIAGAGPVAGIAAGGSARALGHLAVGLRGLRPTSTVNEIELSLEELHGLSEILVHATHAERLALPGMRRSRADLLPTAVLILQTVAERTGVAGFTVCDWGLREGVLLEAVGALR